MDRPRRCRFRFAPLVFVLALCSEVVAQEGVLTKNTIAVAGTGFTLNDRPFPYTGVSFFNAIYNPAFNKSSEARAQWLARFRKYGVNVVRVWCQWDNARGFADAGPGSTMYEKDDEGALRAQHVKTLKEILGDADRHGVVVELVFFSQESWRENIRLSDRAMDRAVESLARELKPYRNLTFQVWNEFDHRVPEALAIIKKIDPARLVTNSPGFAGVLGKDEHNRMLDYLTPHTSRQGKGRTWEIAPREIAGLIKKFNKPVVDDEPARNGTSSFGGPKDKTYPMDHMLHVYEVVKVGGHPTYHHDMFQTGYGTPAVPPSGIPDPEFGPYHRAVFEFLATLDRYRPRTP